MNTFGTNIRLTTFGESHGVAIGGVLDGFPANFAVDFAAISAALDRRAGRTDAVSGVSARAQHEADEIEWLSGIFEGKTLGTPIAFIIRNRDVRSKDYETLKDVYRPGHADYTYDLKYGIRDHRGGGRASARETAVRVVAGGLVQQWLGKQGVTINAVGEAGGDCGADDSVGGFVTCTISGLPAGVGEPIYDKVQARLAYAMLSINACKGFEYDEGFAVGRMLGSEVNKPVTESPVLGGITTGSGVPLRFRVVFKPTPSIAREQTTINASGEEVAIAIRGRHDRCVALRGSAIVEAMSALVIADFLL